MRVLLVNPPMENLLTVGLKSFTGKRGFHPAVGILYVASYARRFTEHEIDVLDCSLAGVGFEELEEVLRERPFDIVGISTTTFTLIDCVAAARVVKKVSPHVPVVFGGIHVSIFPWETIGLPEVDYAVVGEGEKTFAELLECIEHKGPLKNVKGILYKEEGKAIHTGQSDPIEDLDCLPFPCRELTQYKNFYSLMGRTWATTMITSRGCPYRCVYCIRSRFMDSFRARSAGNVTAEIKHCLDMGIEEFYFWDDTFTLDRKRTMEICDRIIAEKLDIRWSVMTRVDRVDRELMQKMKQAGCTRVRFGNESGSQEILNILRKGISPAQIREAFRIAREAGVATNSYFMIGSPGETKKQVRETVKLAKKLTANFSNFSIVTLYPGTELYEMALAKGILKKDVWRDFARHPKPGFQLPVWEEIFSRQELIKLQAWVYRSYYFRLSFIMKKLREISTWRELKEIVLNAMRLLAGITRRK